MRTYISNSNNPYINAAIEDTFYNQRSADEECALLFYVNEPTVVFGRSQNPWMEADIAWCQANGIHILRRFSGGGTVVHDAGNLNYSFFVPRNDYSPDKYVGMVVEALQGIGLDSAHIAGQHSIYAGDKKISGSAFALNSKTAMLHGCILVNSDLSRLSRALHINPNFTFETSTVPSVRAPVANVSDYIPGILLSDVCEAILAVASPEDAYPQQPPAPSPDSFAQYQADNWTYGRTPPFNFIYNDTRIAVKQGIIAAPDSLANTPFSTYMSTLLNKDDSFD